MQEHTPDALTFQGITKTFPGVVALEDVSFSIRPGEVHGLVGENGAGKSTLIKILCGVHAADAGEIHINGRKVHIANTTDAKNAGIQVMHQEISVLPNMTVAENMLMYDMPRKGGIWADEKKLYAQAGQILKSIGLSDINPRRRLGELSLAAQQMINLARIVSTNPGIILLDEPTASLTANEVERLFEVIGRYKKQGTSIIYISHYLDEVLRICDRVTVLRDGRYIETVNACDTRKEDIVYAMIGKKIQETPHVDQSADETVLRMKSVSAPKVIRRVSLDIRKQEVLGLYGLNGAGKTETLRAIMGLDPILQGTISLHGRDVTRKGISEMTAQGVVYVPEDRRRQGLVLQMSVLENCTLGNENKYARFGMLNFRKERRDAQKSTDSVRVKTPSLDVHVATLSGGNQQKVILARCLARASRVYLMDEPTVGIDVGAREEIYELISSIVRGGSSVLLASSDITEVMKTCDRIAVIAHGTVVKVLDRKEATEENLLLYAMED